MSIIIRLQNLAWSASSVDIRRYFSGLSIPEGGVHIVGGEKGDAFIAFSTDEDARLAMEKDGGKIKEMKIKLLLSSRTEMMRVIEQARQQNVTAQPVDSDRRKGAGAGRPERSPSPRSRRSSPGRDKRRSSKRERSRSRSRSPGRRSRDVDRRNNNDRSRRDDRRPDESAQRFNRDERPKRDASRDHDRKNENANYYDQRGQKNYPFPADSKIPAFDARNNTPQNDPGMMPYRENRGEMSLVSPPLGYQRGGVGPPEISKEKEVFDKRPHLDASLQDKPRRKSRFDSEFPSEPDGRFLSDSATDNGMRKPLIHRRDPNLENDPNIAYNRQEPSVPFGMRDDGNRHESRNPPFGIREAGNRPWQRETENGDWVEKRPGLLDPPRVPVPKNKDFVQVVPMDLDDEQNSPERSLEQGQLHRPPFGNPNPSSRDRVENTGLSFARNENQQPNALLRSNQESAMDSRKFLSRHTEKPNFLVRVRGLNQNATESDVLHLFQGIRLFPENITLEADSDGLVAYADFLNANDFDEALSRNMQFIGRNRVQISSCVSTTKLNIPPNLPLRPKDLCVQLRGLPLACKEDNIVHFFNDLAILDLFIEREGDGRPTGIGYVEFSKVEDFHESLSMNGTLLGHHVVSVIEITKELKIIAKRESMKKQEQFQYEQNAPPIKPQRPPQQGVPMCIVMRGLPETVLNRDIADFFTDVNVIPRAIHIMLKNKIPSGDAFAELCNTKDVDHALQQNGKFLLGVRISVTPITFQEMTEIMGRPAVPNASEPPPMMPPKAPPLMQPHAPEIMEPPHVAEHPHHMQSRPQAPALLRTPGEASDRPRPLIATEPQQPPHGGGRVVLERFQPPRAPPFPRMRGVGFRGRPPMRPYGSDGHPPRGPRLFPPRSERPSRFPRSTGPPPSTQGEPKDFGIPGCVVGINNLHFHAGLVELLKFFEDYSPGKDSIIRKYNEYGQTTGEARIAFQNPDDAQRAVKELNHKTIMGRPLNLCVM